MAELTCNYVIIGSPIKITADCNDTSSIVCFTGRTVCSDDCNEFVRDERICTVVPLTGDVTTGTITWNGETASYTITKECPTPPGTNCCPVCNEMVVYTVPKYITDDYDGDIEVHYEYYLTNEEDGDDGEVCSREKKSGVDIIKISDLSQEQGCKYHYTVKKETEKPSGCGDKHCETGVCLTLKEDPCKPGMKLYLTVTLSNNVIPPNRTGEDGKPIFDEDWKVLPPTECFDEDGNPVIEGQCCDIPGGCESSEEEDSEGNPRNDENGDPIPYYTVYVTISYKLVETDEECKSYTEAGIIRKPWHIPPCTNDGCYITAMVGNIAITEVGVSSKGGDLQFSVGLPGNVKPTPETYPCCFGRDIIGKTSVEDIIEILKNRGKISSSDDIDKVYYKGLSYSKEGEIEYSVHMNPKKDGECEGICQETEKYGVVANTVKVYYETEFMSNVWVTEDEGTGCSCGELSLIDKETGNVISPYYVPFYGGRIKVTWDYVRHSTSDVCSEMYNYDTWEEIIMIGGCDERPTECNVCNGHGTGQGESTVHSNCDCDALQLFSKECEACDAECCYDEFGGKCSLLFKEQFPDFWDEMLMCDSHTSKMTMYMCKHCSAVTPVWTSDCNPTPPVDDQGHEWCPSCEDVEDGILVPIEFDMSHESVTTRQYECTNCHALLKSPGTDSDCEEIVPTKCPYCKRGYDGEEPFEYVIVNEETNWYNKVRYEFKQDCNKVCDYNQYVIYEHKDVTLECTYSGEYVDSVKYTATTEFIGEGCPKDIINYGVEEIVINIEANENDFTRTIIDDERITIKQEGCEDTSICGCSKLNLEEKTNVL